MNRGPNIEARLAVVELVIPNRRWGWVILREDVGDGTRAGLR